MPDALTDLRELEKKHLRFIPISSLHKSNGEETALGTFLRKRISGFQWEAGRVTPVDDAYHVCGTCGNPGASHPTTSYCFDCGADNWVHNGDSEEPPKREEYEQLYFLTHLAKLPS